MVTHHRCDDCGKPGHVYLCPRCSAREAADVANPIVCDDGLGPARPIPEPEGGPFRLEAWAASDGDRWGPSA